MDKRGKLFGKINVIDALVVFLIIALLGAVVFRFTSPGMVRTADNRVEFTLMIEGVRDFTLPYYQPGLRVFDRRQNEHIGDIVNVRYEPLIVPMILDDGAIIMVERPGILRIFLDLEADTRETESAILINGAYELRVGSRIMINTRYIDVEAQFIAARMID